MTDAEQNIRAFLAIRLPENILQAVSRVQEKLKREISGKVSWTKPQGQHLTLKFFGDISQNDAANICAALKSRIATKRELALGIEKLGLFPDARRPRVLWMGLAGEVERLTALQKELETDFERLGFPPEDRPFHAHLTLGRIKVPQAVGGIDAALIRCNNFKAEEFICQEIILFQSKLTPQGAVHTRLASFALVR
jgi:RNA 2',3'-cyclic 3'-phosphodiesterase